MNDMFKKYLLIIVNFILTMSIIIIGTILYTALFPEGNIFNFYITIILVFTVYNAFKRY